MKPKKAITWAAATLFIGIGIGWFVNSAMQPARHSDGISGHSTAAESVHQEYTCSMHPQIRQQGPGKCPLCGMDLIPITKTSSVGEDNPYVLEMTPEAIALADIQTSTVKIATPEKELHLSGKVQADESSLSALTSKFPGRVEELFINFTGQEVRQGDKIATIYSPGLVIAQKELLMAAKLKGSNPSLYKAAVEKLRLWKISDTQIREIEAAKKIITDFDVFAYTSGVVTNRLVSLGDYVSTGAVMFEVADLSSVWIMLDAYESDLPWIKMGSRVTYTSAAVPGEKFEARVVYIDPVLDPSTRSVKVRAEATNENSLLKPELLVNAVIKTPVDYTGDALAVDRSSVLWTGKRSVVYVKVPDSRMPSFEMREVTLGPRLGSLYLIESGLSEGEEIVTNGIFAVDGAAQLSGNFSMMNPPAQRPAAIPEAFVRQLDGVTEAYLKLAERLVATDYEAAMADLIKMDAALDNVDMALVKGTFHNEWMTHGAELKAALGKGMEADDIAALRASFSDISNRFISIQETFGPAREPLYIAFCPMASGGNGAVWISDKPKILNPYFGELMLTCGESKGKIRYIGIEKPEPPLTTQPQVHQH